MKPAAELYPDLAKEADCFYGPGDYTPIIDSLGEVIVRQDDDDYEGDTRVLLKRDDQFGFVVIGWGSCSGCDSLQGCDSMEDVQNLADQIESSVRWFDDKSAARTWFESHDWKGDYGWHQEGQRNFLLATWPVLGCAGEPPEAP